ncbi:probable G-protein coupled receptor 160 [Hippoglossus hippoglossus]|uniref:probable G-protein coupled receptor 160 n=1 Tax=Hippoglossus hippoglossus TaxID=8267 RepID=UPI00148CE44D|nr:probable G-protein coupled receptor 160 [Hippoglossus hippoglossus]XP_034446753.1 probable G-protein coupled receptor 160 [Hippoglossus hippoglossus]
MLPDIPVFLETSNNFKMLAIFERWDETSGHHIDNTGKSLLLMLSKFGMDTVVFLLCSGKLYTSFLNMCSLSIVLGDLTMVLYMTAAWLLGPESSPVSLCYFLAHISAAFKALPMPMIAMGIIDYSIEDTRLANKSTFCKFLRNVVLTLLVWMLAVIYSVASTKTELMQLVYATGIKSLACEVKESTFMTYFILGLFSAVILMMLPFSTSIPMWVREADRLFKSREEPENQRSDLFTSTPSTETKSSKENDLGESNWLRPPLSLSLTLGFALVWMPFLTVSAACLAFGFAVPAYISVNLFWLECTKSLLVGVVFWVKSKSLGPYSNLPKNVCVWHVFWHLSKGTWQQQLPTGVFNPSKGKTNPFFYI